MQYFSNGTPLSEMQNESSDEISVMSYNLLAPVYVRPFDMRTGGIQPFAAFEWVQDEAVLEWTSRCQKLLQVLKTCQADVICVQELQLERNADSGEFEIPKWMQPLLMTNPRHGVSDQEGPFYAVQLPPEAELNVIAERNVRVLGVDVAVTCAVLYRTDRFETAVAVENSGKHGESNNENKQDGDTNTSVSVCLVKSDGVEAQPIIVTSVHLDASDEKKRVAQLTRCLRRAMTLSSFAKIKDDVLRPVASIIAGDMNQEFFTGSCVEAFLNGMERKEASESDLQRECASAFRLDAKHPPTKEQLKLWKKLRNEAKRTVYLHCVSLARVETGSTRSAYDHSVSHKASPSMEQWRLDHMLYTSDTLKPLAAWETLEADSESCKAGLPNNRCPSDHLPIAAVYRVLRAPEIGRTECQALVSRLESMRQKQIQELKEVETAFDRELKDLESVCGVASSRKKEKPAKEVIEFMRKRRAVVKDVKARHRHERDALVGVLDNIHRLAVAQDLGYSVGQWAESG